MSDKDIPFDIVRGGVPLVLSTEVDGKKFDLRVALTVLRVVNTGAVSADGNPVLKVQTNVSVHLEPAENDQSNR